MAQSLLARISIPQVSALADPVSINLPFQYIGAGTPGSSDWANLVTACVAFFNTIATGSTLQVSKYLWSSADRGTNHSSVSLYDITSHLDGTPHGSPILTTTFTLGATSAVAGWPEGVAACVSYQSAYGTDVEFGAITAIPTPPDIVADFGATATHLGKSRPRARDRGRFYLGPLGTNAGTTEAGSNRIIFAPQFITDVLHALFALADITLAGNPDWALRVWSRRNAAVKIVTEAWMDDRPDYQRRRTDPSNLKTFLAMPSV